MVKDWAEVCDALGKPHIITAYDHSFTKRRRAYWTNITLPSNFKDGWPPLDPQECMGAGRKIQRYAAHGRMCVRPLGASWEGDDFAPTAATGKPLLVIDEQHDDPQQIRPEEASVHLQVPWQGHHGGEDIREAGDQAVPQCQGGGRAAAREALHARNLILRTSPICQGAE